MPVTTPDVLDGAEIEKIVARLTEPQKSVLLAFNMAPGWKSAPKAGCHRRQGAVAKHLAIHFGLFETRFEKANGLTWFKSNDLARAIQAHLARTRRAVDARSHGGEG